MKPKHRNENLLIQETNDETLVYDIGVNKAYLLNETSAFIWQMCDGNREASEITTALSKKFKQSADEDFVWLTIDLLKKEGLMADAEKLPNRFTANRRETIKRIGLATMMALPLVTALTAPTAANAASGSCGVLCNIKFTNCGGGCTCGGSLVCYENLTTPDGPCSLGSKAGDECGVAGICTGTCSFP